MSHQIFFRVGLGLLALFVIMAGAGIILKGSFDETPAVPFEGPSMQHLLGTDDLGQDVLTLLVRSAPLSLLVGFTAGAISVLVGTAVGMLAGYVRGLGSEVLSGLIDVVLLIPMLPFMVLLSAYLGPGLGNIIAAIACLGWGSTARAVRSKVLQLKGTPFVEALVGLGFSHGRILFRHILPNISCVVSARFVLSVAGAMLSEAALSFMGLGDPLRPSWGKMMHVSFHRGGLANGLWYWYLPPGLCITACTLGFVFLGMSLEARERQKEALPQTFE